MKKKEGQVSASSIDFLSTVIGEAEQDNVHKALTEQDITRQVDGYTNWLQTSKADRTSRQQEIEQEKEQYLSQALQETIIRGKRIKPFAPLHTAYSACTNLSIKQLAVVVLLFFVWSLGLVLSYQITLTITASVITVLYVGDLLLNLFVSYQALLQNEERVDLRVIERLPDELWPKYTVLCPLYQEALIIPQLMKAMQQLDYPTSKLQILLLTEQHDHETYKQLASMELPAHFTILTVPPGELRTKPRACNFGLLHATGDYIVIYDAEDVADPLQLKKAVLAFANNGPEVACVQAKLNFYNVRQNWLTRWFTIEYLSWFNLVMPGLQRLGFPLPLGGTSNHFSTEVLRTLGGWDAFNVTEDCDLGIRLSLHKKKTIIIDSTTFEEATSQLKNWSRQRSRWIKGYMQTYLVHMRHFSSLVRKGQFYELLALQFLIGGKMIAFFLNPLLWILTLVYFLFRPQVETYYHQVFPLPVLYMGMCCLFFGNFFFVYIHLLGCGQRAYNHLVKWCLFLPVYWLFMSVSGFKALYQLIVKPSYWEKTQHGLHLLARDRRTTAGVTIPQESYSAQTSTTLTIKQLLAPNTLAMQTQIGATSSRSPVLPTIHSHHQAAFSREERQTLNRPEVGSRDLWFLITVITASLSSILAYLYFYLHHEILIYGDAYAHMRIARSVFDSATPGITQLGSIWLPLPHILMLPFVWNDYLWKTGIAGSIPAMVCYVVAGIYLFLIARQLTFNSSISFLVTIVFLWNPSVLYLQSIALGEIPCSAAFLAALYYFLQWFQTERTKYLVLAALSTSLATLIRYDGWALLCVLCVCILATCLWKRQAWQYIEGQLLLFLVLGSWGIILWLIWNQMIWGDMLYFQHSEYSAQAQQLSLVLSHRLYAYHNLWQAVRYYTLDVLETSGDWFGVIGFVLLIGFLIYVRRFSALVVVAVLMTPFLFYVTTQFFGQSTIYLPQAGLPSTPVWYNVRYGVQMVASLALALACGLTRFTQSGLLKQKRGLLLRVCFLGVVIAHTLFVHNPPLTDGLANASCERSSDPVNLYLVSHYNGGKILVNQFTSQINAQDYNGYLRDLITEANGDLWKKVVVNPEHHVDWVILNPDNVTDALARRTNINDPAFQAYFKLIVKQSDGLSLYLRRDIATSSLPQNPIPTELLDLKSLCATAQERLK
ncbi:glycosyltransferase family 2 protein [Tengunoibacter tsumagoiensis]|uniref:Uncharacterized protein n=1 Tax=Tengunoibacter tsumagoiensis TaxID=2014871 RepID=A0A402A6R3_9CHLR|nr:glycosyltransferase family 2 protein [Tengunoibacter tsumagoiensis]GCE14822.1 hypothetical protein KTT_46810 [Tengunoibacter tsumagoiensis]